jgi:hypothetical protein
MIGASVAALQPCSAQREGRDRLEILTALINGPSFDPMFRPDVIDIPADHQVYRWICVVDRCERPRNGSTDLCGEHQQQWARERRRGVGKADFLLSATGLRRHVRVEDLPCRICPDRPVVQTDLLLCHAHNLRWSRHRQTIGETVDFAEWCSLQTPLAGYGACTVTVCLSRATSPLGLCGRHESRYDRDGRPGGAVLPERWWHRFEQQGRPVPVDYTDAHAFRRWCATTPAPPFRGQVNLLGLRPLVAAELKWGLFIISTRRSRPSATCSGGASCASRSAIRPPYSAKRVRREHVSFVRAQDTRGARSPAVGRIDAADRLNPSGLEQLRDFFDRSDMGLILIGMPGFDRQLARYPQLYSRVGFAHQYRPLDARTSPTFASTTGSNSAYPSTPPSPTKRRTRSPGSPAATSRLIERLMSQVGRILEINQFATITPEVVEAARQTLVVGAQ